MKTVRSGDGLVHVVIGASGLGNIVNTWCTPHFWTNRTIDRAEPHYVDWVDDAPTCLPCLSRKE